MSDASNSPAGDNADRQERSGKASVEAAADVPTPVASPDPRSAVASVPAGAWAVAVSGGADSVALLELLRARADLSLHVVHLDHQARGGESAADAAFVADLAARNRLPATLSTRAQLEPALARPPRNRAARFRLLRLALFRQVVERHRLLGVLVAHHADDQAETILQRLLRGSGPAGLTGMSADAVIGGVRIVRPLLGVRRSTLRAFLRDAGVAWREDASNLSARQQRNRVRELLAARPELFDAALHLGRSCATLTAWLRDAGPALGEQLEVARLRDLPPPIVRDALRRWLGDRAGVGVEVSPAAIERLLRMIDDAATSPRQHFPGGVLLRRHRGIISAIRPA